MSCSYLPTRKTKLFRFITLRRSKKFKISEGFRKKAVYWANQKGCFAYTNPCNQAFPFAGFEEIIAAGALEVIEFSEGSKFEQLKDHIKKNKDWYFGYFGYDLKNELENLTSIHPSRTKDPEIFFFRPRYLIFLSSDEAEIQSEDITPDKVFEEIQNTSIGYQELPKINFKGVVSKEEYINKVKAIQDHILEGDIYELNFCMEFYSEDVQIDPFSTYFSLIEKSPTPFSAVFSHGDHSLICASPERFLKKKADQIISQPIKGTIKRDEDPVLDQLLKVQLQQDEKERAENMMIVDLVRNDLARSSKYGSVKVEEMFGIYSFRHWHQMISTVSAVTNPEVHFIDIIKNAFPMGSMTGAPKIKVMELIERYEESKRGVYSGAFGYFTPEGDFDFNVVIRSLLYNKDTKVLSFEVGSAITYDAVPEKEYEECLLKAEAIFSIFR